MCRGLFYNFGRNDFMLEQDDWNTNGILIIIMVIFKCSFSGELIALSYKKKQQQRCEHRIRKNKQTNSTVHDANYKMK